MYLHELHVNRFGILNDLTLSRLSPGITVFWGPNGCGKTTVVQFLRGLLFGFSPSHAGVRLSSATGGCIEFTSSGARRKLLRERGVDGREAVRVTDTTLQPISSQNDQHLPAWVTADVFREVLSAGYDEADRFELLTQLCVQSGLGSGSLESEIRSTETAMQQALRERDGDVGNPGIRERIADFRRRQAAMQSELTGLRRPAADLPERIQSLVRDVDQITETIGQIDLQHAELDAEIDRLEKLLIELRRHHTLPLDRHAIETRIRTLTGRLDRWRVIRESIVSEFDLNAASQQSSLRPQDSLLSVRALVARLEDRVQELVGKTQDGPGQTSDWKREAGIVRQLQTETATLCRYLSQHEHAVELHEESLEQFFAERCLTHASQMELLIQERVAGLRAELHRGDDLLQTSDIPTAAAVCRHVLHQDAWSSPHAYGSRLRSEDELQAELAGLCSERTRLVAARGQHEETRYARRALLERLRQELTAAATLEQVDQLRARIAEIDAQVELLEVRERQLNLTEQNLQQVIERLKARCQPRVLELASDFIRRLTDGECTRLWCANLPSQQILVQTQHSPEPLTVVQLSRGTRHQVALALRLALIRVRQEHSVHVPLILDDVFITSDDERAEAVVELLAEFAAAGQQIIFFTCQKDVRDLFERYQADVRWFGNPLPISETQPVLKAYVEDVRMSASITAPAPTALAEMDFGELSDAGEQPADASAVVLQGSTESTVTAAPVPAAAAPSAAPASTNWLFYLEVDHGIDDLAGISLAELQAFRATHIHQIDDLLQRTVSQLSDQLQAAGYDISTGRLQALRGQAELTCRVPMLRRSDAALLFASGIRTVDDLKSLRPETVFDRIVAFQKSEEGSRYRRAGRLIDRQQAINWARWGQHSRTLTEARSQRSRFSTRSTSHVRPGSTMTDDSTRNARRDRMRQTGSLSRRRPLLTGERELNQRRARRLARRRRLAAQSRSLRSTGTSAASLSRSLGQNAPVVTSGSQPSSLTTAPETPQPVERPMTTTHVGGREFRFYLSRSSDVEAAPSIGPRTAENLYSVGVRTVDDLLTISVDILASQLNHRRITTSVIQQWQVQARLMCQVPELRGHDVQILVACGVTSPEDLSHRNPAELLAIVGPFCRTSEGVRILRNGRRPDLAEVTDWIRWAGSARAFRAA